MVMVMGLVVGTMLLGIVSADEEEVVAEEPPTEGASKSSAEETEEDEDNEKTFRSHQDVKTHIVFPKGKDYQFQLGEPINLLVGFRNTGDDTLNLTMVRTFFHSPFDFNFFIQNFTGRPIGQIVPPKTSFTVEYAFLPDSNLEPITYQLSAYTFYTDEDERLWANIVFNDTITMYDAPGVFGGKNYMLYSIVGGGVFFALYLFCCSGKKRSSARRTSQSQAGEAATDEDWIDPQTLKKKQSKVVSRGRSKKKL